jgi:hypothetical protein
VFTRKLFRYSIDKINGRFISGWCFHRIRKDERLTIRFVADDHYLGAVQAIEYRKDLKIKNLHPSGVCGFDFSFPDDFDPGKYRLLKLYVDKARRPLASIDCGDVEVLEPDPATSIYFMHIPKTAGSSFNAFARLCFPTGEYAPHIERLSETGRRALVGNRKYVAGHLPWGEVGPLVEGSAYSLYSLLRDPYKHLHSHLNYVRSVHANAEHDVYNEYKHNDTIKELAARLNKVNFGDDDELQYFIQGLKGFHRDFFDNIQTRYFLDYRPEKVTVEDLENAKKNILRFQLVGLTEYYHIFLDRFCLDMGLPTQSQTEKSNKSEHYYLFDYRRQTTKQILSPLVGVDLLLYQYVSQIFWPELHLGGKSLDYTEAPSIPLVRD